MNTEPYRILLEAERDEILKRLGIRVEETDREADPLDGALRLETRRRHFEQHEKNRDRMYLIDDALGRINDGTYGQCEECGFPIPEKRLRACPEAILCIDCAEAADAS